jgi:hypothetical protein
MIFSFARQCENGSAELHAFPAALAENVKCAVQLLAQSQMHVASDTVIFDQLTPDANTFIR